MLADSHCHVNLPEYDDDRDAVIGRAQEAGVKMLCVGTDAASSAAAVKLAEQYPDGIWAAVGWHPNENLENFRIEKLKYLAGHPKVAAIGECGLDYYRIKNYELGIKEKQKEIFLAQIQLAAELQKPLMIHCRPSRGTDDVYEDLLAIIHNSKFMIQKAVHFFVGSLKIAEKLLEAGCYFTFGGVITFSRDYDEVIKYLPLQRILLETDAPYVSPEPHRGRRNEPVYVIEVAKRLAEIKGLTFEKTAQETYNNFCNVFLSPSKNRSQVAENLG